MDLEKTGSAESKKSISQEEYEAIKRDLTLINKSIQKSEGVIDVNESDFKSEYGRKRYHDLKSIAEGKPVTFNKTELQRIGDELEGLLSGSHEEKKEDKAPGKVEPKAEPKVEDKAEPKVEDKIPEVKPEPLKESENDRIKRLALEKARQKAGVVNVDALAEKEARYMADKHIQESKANLTGVRGFFKKFKYTFLGSYLRAKKVNQVRDDILKTGNIYAGQNIDKSEHEKAMNQVANRFIQEYEETMSKGDEKRALDAHDPVAAKAKSDVKQLIYDYAEGKISDDIFLTQKDRIINNLKNQDLLAGADNYADNLFEIAKNARVAVEHGAKLEELDLNTDFIIGRAKSAIKTEGNFGLIDNTVDKLKKSRIGRYISPAILTTAVGLVYSASVIGSKVARSKTAALITLGGTALLAGAIAGADKSHDLQDKIRQLRERRGRGRENEAPDKLDEFMYNTESAEALTNNLRSLMYMTDANGELVLRPIDASNASQIMGAVAQIKALKNMNDRNNIDLISYSDVSKMEAEKTELEILTGQAREELRKQFTGNLSGMLNGANFENYLAQHVKTAEDAITGGAKGVDAQNSAFSKFKRKEVVKKALWTCTAGMIIGATVQEGLAYFNPNVQGYVEGLTGHHDAHATLQTPIAQLRDLLTGNHTNIPGGGVDVHNFVHDTKEIITDAKGWVNNPLNNTEHISRQTWFGNNTEMYGHAPNYAQTHEWLMRPDPQTGVMGSGANLNELGTQWGGVKGLLPNGDHILSISHMTPGGSFQGGLSVDAQEAMKKGMLQAMISLTDGTQNHAIPVNILPNGDVIFDHNNPIMQQIFTQDPVTGQTINHARFIEIVQNMGVDAHGVKQVIPLGTLEGEGLDKIKDIVDTVKDVVTHTDTPIGMQPPLFLPTYLNKALIREKVKEAESKKKVSKESLDKTYRPKHDDDAKNDNSKLPTDYSGLDSKVEIKKIETITAKELGDEYKKALASILKKEGKIEIDKFKFGVEDGHIVSHIDLKALDDKGGNPAIDLDIVSKGNDFVFNKTNNKVRANNTSRGSVNEALVGLSDAVKVKLEKKYKKKISKISIEGGEIKLNFE